MIEAANDNVPGEYTGDATGVNGFHETAAAVYYWTTSAQYELAGYCRGVDTAAENNRIAFRDLDARANRYRIKHLRRNIRVSG